MRGELICEACGATQEHDPHPDPRCLECGFAAFPATRCYGCHTAIPQKPRCPRCNVPTLPPNLYPAALMLRYKGVDLLSLADRVKALSAREREDWEARYFAAWKQVDEARDSVARALAGRVAPSMIRLILENLDRLRGHPGVTPEAIIQSLEAVRVQYLNLPPTIAPFPLAVCKAIHEAAPWKLGQLHWRVRWNLPARGLGENEVKAIGAHAEALAGGPNDARFAAGAAYLNAFTYAHSLVLGEVFNRNNPSPVFDLESAARAQESVLPGVPVCLVRGTGVVWAVGPRPAPDLRERWVPEGFVFVPRRGPSLRLHELDGLREFLRAAKIPVVPESLSVLVHLLLAPFPWESRVKIDPELLARWEPLEAEIADRSSGREEAAKLLGLERKGSEFRDELEVRLEPSGTTLVYRPPELEVR